jgi:microcystin-dependent protein
MFTRDCMVNLSSIIPVGCVIWRASTSDVPDAFLLCNGASLPSLTWPALYTVIGTTYGSDSATTFKLPNLTGRVIQNTSPLEKLTTSDGQSTQTLTLTNIQAHNHPVQNLLNASHGHTAAGQAHTHPSSYMDLNHSLVVDAGWHNGRFIDWDYLWAVCKFNRNSGGDTYHYSYYYNRFTEYATIDKLVADGGNASVLVDPATKVWPSQTPSGGGGQAFSLVQKSMALYGYIKAA